MMLAQKTPFQALILFAPIMLVSLWASCASGLLAETNTNAPTVISLRDFSGADYLSSPGVTKQLGIGWVREGFYWGHIEPQRGNWQWADTDHLIMAARAEDVEVLPLIAFTAPWAASRTNNIFSPSGRVEDWKDFVEHVVARYSRPPFNLRYFQVWNEPTRQAKFWTGTDEEFVDEVYLPAARIIREHGCYVVFGGWPDSNNLQEFDSVLEYHEAWRWTDILDVHYVGLPAWEYLYDHWVKPERCNGIWETELGFTDDPDYIPTTYLPMLYWSLKHGWNDPNQYKLFWYAAWGGGADGPKCLSRTDAAGQVVLSDQGKLVAVLYRMLGAGSLTVFSDYKVTPPLPSQSLAMGFKSGRRIVITILFNRSLLTSIHFVSVRVSLPQKPGDLNLINEDGARMKFTARFHKGFVTAKIPLQPLAPGSGKMTILYLQVDPLNTKN